MIDFRYHLVSIIAIFFALAAGIALGAGPLKPGVDSALSEQTNQLRTENQDLRDQVSALNRAAAYEDAFDAAVAGDLLEGTLSGQRVVTVVLPGAGEDTVNGVKERLTVAGADAPTTVTVLPNWTEPGSEGVLDELAVQLVSSGTTLPEGDGWTRGAAVLASALVTPPTDGTSADAATATLTAFEEAGLVSVDGDNPAPAGLAVLVAGPQEEEEEDAVERERVAFLPLVGALDGAGQGSVLAGPPATAGETGLVGALRADGDLAERVSTNDAANHVSGQVAVALALREQVDGNAGHYGFVGDVDGPVPPRPAPVTASP